MKPSLPDLQASPKPVFITGATGFIGQRLVSVLLGRGYSLRVAIRPEKQHDSRIPPGCEQLAVGLTDVEKLTNAIADSSAVIYCAGTVRGREPEDFATANINGVKAVLSALQQVQNTSGESPQLLLLSSLAASRPALSDYTRSKHEGEKLLLAHPSLAWTILRPPAVYGPGDQEMLPLFKMIRRGLLTQVGPKGQRLSLLHVDDLAAAIASWLSSPQQCLHKTYSIDDGTPGGYGWQTIGEAVADGDFRSLKIPQSLLEFTAKTNLVFSSLFGYAPMLTPGKARELTQAEWLCDNSAFTGDTGWKPDLDLKQGVQQLFQ